MYIHILSSFRLLLWLLLSPELMGPGLVVVRIGCAKRLLLLLLVLLWWLLFSALEFCEKLGRCLLCEWEWECAGAIDGGCWD